MKFGKQLLATVFKLLMTLQTLFFPSPFTAIVNYEDM